LESCHLARCAPLGLQRTIGYQDVLRVDDQSARQGSDPIVRRGLSSRFAADFASVEALAFELIQRGQLSGEKMLEIIARTTRRSE
jgi:hypothetical protein